MSCEFTSPPIWNSTDCAIAYEALPTVIQDIRRGLAIPSRANKLKAQKALESTRSIDLHGVMRENYRKRVRSLFPSEPIHPSIIIDMPLTSFAFTVRWLIRGLLANASRDDDLLEPCEREGE